ncbi:MAG: sulfotransferase [Pseudomonadota bacterium]
MSAQSTSRDAFHQATAALREGQAGRAVDICLSALKAFGDDPNILCLAGQALIAARRPEDALAPIKKSLKLFPEFAGGHEAMADLLMVEGRFGESLNSYRHSLELDPDRSHVARKIERAQALAASASDTPSEQQVIAELEQAEALQRDGQHAKAESIIRGILKRNPNHAEALRQLAKMAVEHHKYEDAETLLERAVARKPDYARAWLDLSRVQTELGKYADAMQSAERIVVLAPEVAESYISLANAQAQYNLTTEAIDNYRKALDLVPGHPGAYSGLAHQLKTVGEQSAAIEAHRNNIAANPTNTEPYWNLANLKTFRFEDTELEAMMHLLATAELEPLGEAQLCNALALEHEGRKEYDLAFDYFRRCNEAQRQLERYDPVGQEILIDSIIEVFSREFLEAHANLGCGNTAPIFIVGLPRSGSTLIEQILASHSLVEGTHELSDLPQLVQGLKDDHPARAHFPQNLSEMGDKVWRRFGQAYLQCTEKYRSEAPHFIDKNPNNFVYAGLLQLALPGAKIINARRHPLDSCFGSYKQLFASGQPFTYDLIEIGEYYLLYDRLMRHWHDVMPGQVLDVDYESVVADLEGQVQRILDYCDLPYEDSCVNFHRTQRSVKTASSEQVRQPIYTSSLNLWKRYEPHLDVLIDVLAPLLADLPRDAQPNQKPL